MFSFRSTGTLNKHHGKQKISFSRKFPFMKSRERLNKLDDEDSFENGSNHRCATDHIDRVDFVNFGELGAYLGPKRVLFG